MTCPVGLKARWYVAWVMRRVLPRRSDGARTLPPSQPVRTACLGMGNAMPGTSLEASGARRVLDMLGKASVPILTASLRSVNVETTNSGTVTSPVPRAPGAATPQGLVLYLVLDALTALFRQVPQGIGYHSLFGCLLQEE